MSKSTLMWNNAIMCITLKQYFHSFLLHKYTNKISDIFFALGICVVVALR